jgi:hypothetical protein
VIDFSIKILTAGQRTVCIKGGKSPGEWVSVDKRVESKKRRPHIYRQSVDDECLQRCLVLESPLGRCKWYSGRNYKNLDGW